MYVKKKRIFLIGKIQKRIKLVSNNVNRQANGRHLLHSTVLSLLLLSAGSWVKDVPSVHRLWTLSCLVLCRARPLLSPRVVKAPSSGGLGLCAFSGLVYDLLLRGLEKRQERKSLSLGSLTTAILVSFDLIVSYSSCWGWSSIKTLKF